MQKSVSAMIMWPVITYLFYYVLWKTKTILFKLIMIAVFIACTVLAYQQLQQISGM